LQGFARFFKKPCNLCEKYAQYRASIQNKVLFCRNEGAYQVRRNIKTLDFRLKTVYYLVNTIRKERLISTYGVLLLIAHTKEVAGKQFLICKLWARIMAKSLDFTKKFRSIALTYLSIKGD
jgi:hypothetical protein